MSRPRIVRADTLDLQDQNAPSAKDHATQNVNPAPLDGGMAPHQELSIRHADQDTRAEIMHGPTGETDGYGDGIDMYDDDEDPDERHHDLGGGSSEDGDLTDGEGDDLMDDDMDKISSSPSIDDEDIDFEFVYAFHNFVATVEGQANAAKGDTMVLLDDSNTYWWLVRIVKDGSIGYLPAEHIETPTERLARLNKHRNVDLSATMLGDNSEKSKNPLKKAMRRRNTKNVVFTAPTYIEASDVEYSTEDEDDGGGFYIDDEDIAETDDIEEGHDEDIVVEPLRPKSQREKEAQEPETVRESQETERQSPEPRQSAEEAMESEEDGTVSRSRNGTVRNTDSFFKDDTAEPKKISLTPNLLRDEGNKAANSEGKEDRSSMEAIEKVLAADDKKEDKKRKDKKPGMLSGLFKRKDKKNKAPENEGEEQEKLSSETSRSPKASLDSVSSPEGRSPNNGKLQKQPPGSISPTKRDPQYESAAQDATRAVQGATSTTKGSQWIRQVVPEEEEEEEPAQSPLSSPQSASSPIKQASPPVQARNIDAVASPIEANNRLWQDAFGERTSTQQQPITSPQRISSTQNLGYQNRGLESPIDVSPIDPQARSGAPGLIFDLSPEKRSDSPVSPPSSPGADTNGPNTDDTRSATSPQTPTWSDASLRSYLDDDNDIRDLFIIVHDKSNVPPAGPDHPITGSLFKEESKRLREMTGRLDGMLAEWVGRKSQSQMVNRI
ncbi:SH3 domain-containing protein [Aspergillus glaucus CBS 516.65]|uniref:SH3 domain-containing protein n=1 Tax=Aspergillus glaucus CBS 516.65 TaxID=1160497 RepID=A0A1L9V563_ASPGL|nr:hypothetical protein ASPGLDRAFT_70400 [Aspergillus glaucus CBS 516.65]OJJ79046.1 hypothetical protein ASPGLDRAFT_70400 [Aspergillus glaucus CBS 516.65]